MTGKTWIVFCCAMLACGVTFAQEVEQRVAPDEVPKLIVDAAKKLAGADAVVIAAERITEVEEKAVHNTYVLTMKRKKGTIAEVEVHSTDKAGIRGAGLSEAIVPRDLPPAITNVVKRLCPGEIIGAEMEIELERGRRDVEYRVRVKRKDGPVANVHVEMSGRAVEEAVVREPLAFSDLPKTVLASAKAARPNAKMLSATRITVLEDDELSVEYIIPIREKDGGRRTIAVATKANGAIRRVEVEDEEDDDDDEDDD
jgi:hypothetical protein